MQVFTESTHIVAVRTTGNVFCFEVGASPPPFALGFASDEVVERDWQRGRQSSLYTAGMVITDAVRPPFYALWPQLFLRVPTMQTGARKI